MWKIESRTNIPDYILVPIALVYSELCWFSSALYWVFLQTGLVAEESSPAVKQLNRLRANSAPSSSSESMRIKNNIDYTKSFEDQSERRYSLPTIPSPNVAQIRHKPSVHDEQVGTTCPPIWWQKTRVKLGHTPVHGDLPQPKSYPVLGNTVGFSDSINTVDVTTCPPSPSMVSSASSSTFSVKSDGTTESKRRLAKKKIMSKLHSAFHSTTELQKK